MSWLPLPSAEPPPIKKIRTVKLLPRVTLRILCGGVPWLFDDGIRVMPDDVSDWIKFHDLFCKMLNEAGVEYYLIPKTMLGLEERLAMVLSVWKEG